MKLKLHTRCEYGFYNFRNGGGTGTRASHVIARAARELNILTVGVTTTFSYEAQRMRRAMEGSRIQKHLDTVIVVPVKSLEIASGQRTKDLICQIMF